MKIRWISILPLRKLRIVYFLLRCNCNDKCFCNIHKNTREIPAIGEPSYIVRNLFIAKCNDSPFVNLCTKKNRWICIYKIQQQISRSAIGGILLVYPSFGENYRGCFNRHFENIPVKISLPQYLSYINDQNICEKVMKIEKKIKSMLLFRKLSYELIVARNDNKDPCRKNDSKKVIDVIYCETNCFTFNH